MGGGEGDSKPSLFTPPLHPSCPLSPTIYSPPHSPLAYYPRAFITNSLLSREMRTTRSSTQQLQEQMIQQQQQPTQLSYHGLQLPAGIQQHRTDGGFLQQVPLAQAHPNGGRMQMPAYIQHHAGGGRLQQPAVHHQQPASQHIYTTGYPLQQPAAPVLHQQQQGGGGGGQPIPPVNQQYGHGHAAMMPPQQQQHGGGGQPIPPINQQYGYGYAPAMGTPQQQQRARPPPPYLPPPLIFNIHYSGSNNTYNTCAGDLVSSFEAYYNYYYGNSAMRSKEGSSGGDSRGCNSAGRTGNGNQC